MYSPSLPLRYCLATTRGNILRDAASDKKVEGILAVLCGVGKQQQLGRFIKSLIWLDVVWGSPHVSG